MAVCLHSIPLRTTGLGPYSQCFARIFVAMCHSHSSLTCARYTDRAECTDEAFDSRAPGTMIHSGHTNFNLVVRPVLPNLFER